MKIGKMRGVWGDAMGVWGGAESRKGEEGRGGKEVEVELFGGGAGTGVTFRGGTLNVSNEGIFPAGSISIKSTDGTALRGMNYEVTLSANSEQEEWCKIEAKGNALSFTIEPYSGKDRSRSVNVSLKGSGEGVTLNPFEFKVVQAATPKSAEAHILSFEVPGQVGVAEIDYQTLAIGFRVPYGTDVTGLKPVLEISPNATVSPASGAAVDFSSPVKYTVTAEDGTTKNEYTVTVTVEAKKSDKAEIVSFKVNGQLKDAAIDHESGTVTVVVPGDMSLAAVAPQIEVSEGASVDPESGSTVNLSVPVKYTVTAEDGVTKKEYTVSAVVGGMVDIDPASTVPGNGASLIGTSGKEFLAVVAGAEATTVKMTVMYDNQPVTDLSGYDLSVKATDMKTGQVAGWITLSAVGTDGKFTFSVSANGEAGARRATIEMNCTDRSGQKVFGAGKLNVVQDGSQTSGVLVEMIEVQGGRFMEGKSIDPGWNVENMRYANVSTFYIGKYEITQKQFEEVMGYNPSLEKGDDLPVEYVNWYDAAMFCDKLSEREGYTKFYNLTDVVEKPAGTHSGKIESATINIDYRATGYRLPTNAEWEYAANGGAEQAAIELFRFAGSNDIEKVAWYRDNSGDKVHPVGQKDPNTLGIYDMSGNVWEWIHDWYSGNIMGFDSPDEVTDPFGPDGPSSPENYKIFRGGGYNTYNDNCRVRNTKIMWINLSGEYNDPSSMGFRIARR